MNIIGWHNGRWYSFLETIKPVSRVEYGSHRDAWAYRCAPDWQVLFGIASCQQTHRWLWI